MSNAYGPGAKGKATKLHAEIVRARGRCERCGATGRRLECAHIVSRRFSATRTDETNAWALCSPCHAHLTMWPHEHVAFAWKTHGQDGFEALCLKAKSNARPWKQHEWETEYQRLLVVAREMGVR